MKYDTMGMMDIKEFVNKGYLQELNRQFLHPLGLSLTTSVDPETGRYILGGILDKRCFPEGWCFDQKSLNVQGSVDKVMHIAKEFRRRKIARKQKLRYFIQPVFATEKDKQNENH